MYLLLCSLGLDPAVIGGEGMLWYRLMCYWEDADWRGPPAVESAAVLPYLLNYVFHSGSSLK